MVRIGDIKDALAVEIGDTGINSFYCQAACLTYCFVRTCVCDFDDDRMDGYLISIDNWNVFTNGPVFGRSFGIGYSSDAEGNKVDLWETAATGYMDWDMIQTIHVVHKGRGINQGLLANTTWRSSEAEFPFAYVEGVLIDSGE